MICCRIKVSGRVMSISTSGLLCWLVRPSFTTSGKYLDMTGNKKKLTPKKHLTFTLNALENITFGNFTKPLSTEEIPAATENFTCKFYIFYVSCVHFWENNRRLGKYLNITRNDFTLTLNTEEIPQNTKKICVHTRKQLDLTPKQCRNTYILLETALLNL